MRTYVFLLFAAAAALAPLSRAAAQDDLLTFHYGFGTDNSESLEGRLIAVRDSAMVVYHGDAPDYRLLADTVNMATLPLASVKSISRRDAPPPEPLPWWSPFAGALGGALIGGIIVLSEPEVDDVEDIPGAIGTSAAQENSGVFIAVMAGLGAAIVTGYLLLKGTGPEPEPTIIYRQGDDLSTLRTLAFVKEE